jgi:hypothetical protein
VGLLRYQSGTSIPGQQRIWNEVRGQLFGGAGGTTESFLRIGHSLLTLIAAISGGLLSRLLYATSGAAGSESIIPEGSTS